MQTMKLNKVSNISSERRCSLQQRGQPASMKAAPGKHENEGKSQFSIVAEQEEEEKMLLLLLLLPWNKQECHFDVSLHL